MNAFGLDRLVWRFDAGLRSETTLAAALVAERERLVTERYALDRRSPATIASPSAVVVAFEQAIKRAHELTDSRRYHPAVRQLRSARAALATLTHTLGACLAMERARRRRDALVAQPYLEMFFALPSLVILDRLLERADAYLRALEWRKALFAARCCDGEMDRLFAPDAGDERLRGLRAQVERFAFCYGDVLTDPAAAPELEAILRLGKAGLVPLAERLLPEVTTRLIRRWRDAQTGRQAGPGITPRPSWDVAMVRDLARIVDEAERLGGPFSPLRNEDAHHDGQQPHDRAESRPDPQRRLPGA